MIPLRRWLTEGRPQLGVALLALAAVSIGMLLFEGARAPAAFGAPPFRHFDKVMHFGAHGWVAGLLFWGGMLVGRPSEPARRVRTWAISVFVADALAGIAVEFVQRWLGAEYGRQFDLKDVLANVSGMCVALAISAPTSMYLTRTPSIPADL